jgi:hypothetical protein
MNPNVTEAEGAALLRKMAEGLDLVEPLLPPGYRVATVLLFPGDVNDTIVVGNVPSATLRDHLAALADDPTQGKGIVSANDLRPLRKDLE